MSAAPASTVQAASRAVSGSSVIGQAGAELLPATDTLWLDVYHVIAPLPGSGDVQLWRANRTDTAEEVVLRVAKGEGDPARAEVWARLAAIESPNLQRAREIHFIAGHRIEICDAIHGTPLNVWRAARTSVDLATVESVVRQLAEALGVLHASGLVHLGLRPENIFVREQAGGWQCVLGGLESVTRFESDAPIFAPVDPLYAPPEAATLVQHEPGPTMCAWDWWSLGRVAQELILGHHVVNKLPDADPSWSPAMRSARAETLLLEHAAKGMRAGAVEVMVGLDSRLDLLLRGLLSSAVEKRWGAEFVDRWLRQKPVKDHYTVLRTDQKFRWRGRLYTVPEAAKALRTAEHWDEAAPHLFEPDAPGTLAHFLLRSTQHELLRQQLAELRKLSDSEPLRSLPPAVAREVVLTVGLLLLAGANLIWRGRRLDGETLHTLLAEDAENPERLALVRVFTHRTITSQIDRFDFEAGRSLAEVGRVVADAESAIRRHGWAKELDDQTRCRIFRLALETDATLRSVHERLRRDFACSNQPAVEKIFMHGKPTRAELVALAWVEPAAAQCGFVTHVEWQTKQLAAIHERGGALIGALFWGRLGRALSAGSALFGSWLAVVACWGGAATLVMVAWPGPKWLAVAFLPAALALAARVGLSPAISSAVRKFAPAGSPWKWTDGSARCAAELRAAGNGRDGPALESSLTAINAEIAQLTLLSPTPAPLAGPPYFGALRGVALASWIALGAVVAACGWRCKVSPPSWSAFQTAWVPSSSVAAAVPVEAPGGTDSVALAAKPVAAEAAAPSGTVKVSWPYKPGDDAQVVSVQETLSATDEQIAWAVKHGRALAEPYRPETITTLIVFEVPMGDRIGVVVYDAVKRSLVKPQIYLLGYRPLARSWVDIAGLKGIYLAD